MDRTSRSLRHTTMFAKRSFESDTWLTMGITAIIFAVLATIGVWILCYRRRGHKRRIDRRRLIAAKTRGNYVQLDEEKAGAEDSDVPLKDRSSVGSSSSSSNGNSPQITPPPPVESRSQAQIQTTPSRISTPPMQHNRRKNSSPQPQLEFTGVTLHHPQPQSIYLPPPVASDDRGSHLSSPEYTHDYDYDGRTGHRIDRSRSPSPSRLVLSRSISMLRPREQQG